MGITVTSGVTFGSGITLSTPSAPVSYTVWTAGANTYGELAQNDRTYRSSPVQVGASLGWRTLRLNQNNGAGVDSEGRLWSWGRAQFGSIGNNNDVVDRSSPVQIGTATDWTTLAHSGRAVFAQKTSGALWVWGMNSNGRLGTNNVVSLSSPVQLGSATDWSLVDCIQYTIVALKTNGTLWIWGAGAQGQMGNNNVVNRSSPAQLGSFTDWTAIAGGSLEAAAIRGGRLYMWGSNVSGQLGLNDTVYRSSPVQVGVGTDWSSVRIAQGGVVAAIKTNGTLWTWGSNADGGLGASLPLASRRSSPAQVGSGTNWSYIAASGTGGFTAVKTDGTAWTWGKNDTGSRMTNSREVFSSPVQIGSRTVWNVPQPSMSQNPGSLALAASS